MISILFARRDSIYKTLPDCDVWNIDRNALNWPGGCPIIAHPPCRAWGRLRHFAKPRDGERELAIWSVNQVQKWGGVLEHPFASLLWPTMGLPTKGYRDIFGGYTLTVSQWWFGHRADKPTLLYIVGCSDTNLPAIPFKLGIPSHVVQSRKRLDHRPHITKAEREHTPLEMAKFLVAIAERCQNWTQKI